MRVKMKQSKSSIFDVEIYFRGKPISYQQFVLTYTERSISRLITEIERYISQTNDHWEDGCSVRVVKVFNLF